MGKIKELLDQIREEKEERIVDGKRELVDSKVDSPMLANKPEYTKDSDGNIRRMSLQERTERSRSATLAANKTSTKLHRKRSMEKRKNLIG